MAALESSTKLKVLPPVFALPLIFSQQLSTNARRSASEKLLLFMFALNFTHANIDIIIRTAFRGKTYAAHTT